MAGDRTATTHEENWEQQFIGYAVFIWPIVILITVFIVFICIWFCKLTGNYAEEIELDTLSEMTKDQLTEELSTTPANLLMSLLLQNNSWNEELGTKCP